MGNSGQENRAGVFLNIYRKGAAKEIAEAFVKAGYSVDKKQIVLKEGIKNIGEFKLTVKVYPEISATCYVKVVPNA